MTPKELSKELGLDRITGLLDEYYERRALNQHSGPLALAEVRPLDSLHDVLETRAE
jgi:hypothetical protein